MTNEREQYMNLDDTIEIVCRDHGSFWETARRHLAGVGCPSCMAEDSMVSRVFLTYSEWYTYAYGRQPVRYIKKRKSDVCSVCGKPGTTENPLQHAHIIPFMTGVKEFGLTPDYLDRHSNITTAHRQACNQQSELTSAAICKKLIDEGVAHLPEYVSAELYNLFETIRAATL